MDVLKKRLFVAYKAQTEFEYLNGNRVIVMPADFVVNTMEDIKRLEDEIRCQTPYENYQKVLITNIVKLPL